MVNVMTLYFLINILCTQPICLRKVCLRPKSLKQISHLNGFICPHLAFKWVVKLHLYLNTLPQCGQDNKPGNLAALVFVVSSQILGPK